MTDDRMVHMANQIAQYFSSYPREESIPAIADHLEKFWEKRMRRQLVEYVAAGGAGLHDLALEAARRLPAVK